MSERLHLEQRKVPRHIERAVTRAGGTNVHGKPNYRLCWGGSRLTTVVGTVEDPWLDRDENTGEVIREYVGPRQVPKYWMHGIDRWHMERWLAPEEYAGCDPATWERVFARELGPYPAEGEYEHCFSLPRALGTELASDVVEFIVRAVEQSRKLVAEDRAKARQALEEAQAAKARAWDQEAEALLDDARSAFPGPAVAVPAGFAQDEKSGLILPT